MKKSGKTIIFLGAVLAAGAMFHASRPVYAAESDVIAQGVYIGSIPVGGMTEAEATDAVNEYVDGIGSAQITLDCRREKHHGKRRESWNFFFRYDSH